MSQINFFYSDCFKPGSLTEFPLSTCTASYDKWTIEAKLSQENDQRGEEDIGDGCQISHAVATFRVYNQQNNIRAFMRVYLQVPLIGTEFDSPSDRARQASRTEFNEITATKAFIRYQSTVTPRVFAINERIQDDQCPVPGGYIARFVFAKVSGVRLGENHLIPTPDCLTDFFQNFDRAERDMIRRVFSENLAALNKMGWRPRFPGPPHFIWDRAHRQLHFVDFRDAVEMIPQDNLGRDRQSIPARITTRERLRASVISTYQNWETYGLAIPPPEDSRFENDPAKWIL